MYTYICIFIMASLSCCKLLCWHAATKLFTPCTHAANLPELLQASWTMCCGQEKTNAEEKPCLSRHKEMGTCCCLNSLKSWGPGYHDNQMFSQLGPGKGCCWPGHWVVAEGSQPGQTKLPGRQSCGWCWDWQLHGLVRYVRACVWL